MPNMFKKQIRFFGKHAQIMQKYCKDKGGDQDIPFPISNNDGIVNEHFYIFETRIEIYMVGAMLGILNKKEAEEEQDTKFYSTIMFDMIEKQRNNLQRIYQYMVLSDDYIDSCDGKIKKAFSIELTEKDCEEQQLKFENFVRGGLEIIDEYFKDCKNYEDVCNALVNMNSSLDDLLVENI